MWLICARRVQGRVCAGNSLSVVIYIDVQRNISGMIGTTWGATAEERAVDLPCDKLMPGSVRMDRAISIDAPPVDRVRVAVPAACGALQLRPARQHRQAQPTHRGLPNSPTSPSGSRSSESSDSSHVFELAAIRNSTSTSPCGQGISGECHVTHSASVSNTYSVRPEGNGTRLHVRVLFDGPWLLGQTLALVNLIMMRKQLLVLKSLAERDALSGSVGSSR